MAPLTYFNGTPIGLTAVFVALVSSMGGFMFGYDTGQISDILVMDDFKRRFAECAPAASLELIDVSTCEFSTVRSGCIVAFMSIGTLIGCLCGAPLADALGRRYAMVVDCLVFFVGDIIQITSTTHWVQYAIGRIITGLGIGALSTAVPMYQAETSPSQIRGLVNGMYQFFVTFGILMAYCIAIGSRELENSGQWRLVNGLGFTWPTILAIFIQTMPESPRWLAARGRDEEARRAIARVRGVTGSSSIFGKKSSKAEDELKARWDGLIDRELDEMHNTIKYESQSANGTWLDCFKPKDKVLYRTLLGMSIQTFQQLTGANYFFYYGATIFASVGLSDSFITQIIFGAVNFFCTFFGLYVMQKCGRRWPLILGGLWQSAWLFVYGALGTAHDPTEDKVSGKIMILASCLFIFGYATTWAPGAWVIVGETFPMRTRARQSALATASNWLWNFLLGFFTPFITKSIHFRYGFVFAACNLVGSLIIYFFLYESAGLTLEAVDQMYNDPNCRPWTSGKWAPPGYKDRADMMAKLKTENTKEHVEHLDSDSVHDEKVAAEQRT
ncbi:general substrate transporter [Cylindrobasidium torrendii FP15055 ss-10]|uniref:General substrate transporter n=1 Tax=Cylindrobasidium torrendii FP15055 ss-10 TaxID=1314674 RepID=A0A0D7BRP6_9AGAR|nr:general substrate transporter [Cylindrobasidium torrendii FP15055 ss-10]